MIFYILALMFVFFLLGILLLIVFLLKPPKTPNKGSFVALFIGPLTYIYVDRWGKAIGLYLLGWFLGGVAHLIIYPYSIFNIRTEVRRYNDNLEIHESTLMAARNQRIRNTPSISNHDVNHPSVSKPTATIQALNEYVDNGLVCPACEKPVSSDWKTCPYCGEYLFEFAGYVCLNCGREVDENWKNCPYCGESIEEVE